MYYKITYFRDEPSLNLHICLAISLLTILSYILDCLYMVFFFFFLKHIC